MLVGIIPSMDYNGMFNTDEVKATGHYILSTSSRVGHEKHDSYTTPCVSIMMTVRNTLQTP